MAALIIPEVEDMASVNVNGHVFVKIIASGTNVTLKTHLKVVWQELAVFGIGIREETIGLLR